MSRTLIDGQNATMSMTTQGYSAGSLTGTAVEHKCWINTIMAQVRQDVNYINKQTFCSVPGPKVKVPGERDVVFAASGFLSKGAPGDKLGGTGMAGAAIALIMTVDDPTTGSQGSDCCAISSDVFTNEDMGSLIAQGNSSRAIRFESTGAWATVWVET
jgi:hypothetical protein